MESHHQQKGFLILNQEKEVAFYNYFTNMNKIYFCVFTYEGVQLRMIMPLSDNSPLCAFFKVFIKKNTIYSQDFFFDQNL